MESTGQWEIYERVFLLFLLVLSLDMPDFSFIYRENEVMPSCLGGRGVGVACGGR